MTPQQSQMAFAMNMAMHANLTALAYQLNEEQQGGAT